MKTIVLFSAALASLGAGGLAYADDIVHDAEHYVLQAQHGERWAQEDRAIARRLAELEKKHGTKPNIIHIMWDDTALGEVGIPAIQSVRGFETPHMNQMAEDGINFMRMYTEPACTPRRWQRPMNRSAPSSRRRESSGSP